MLGCLLRGIGNFRVWVGRCWRGGEGVDVYGEGWEWGCCFD